MLLTVSSISALLLLCLLIVQFIKLQRRKQQLPPGPTPLPFIGCLWHPRIFLLSRDNLTELAKSYGNVYTIWLGKNPLIILNGFQAVKDGLTTHPEDVSGRPVTPFFRALANNKGILLSTGKTWKHQRRFSLMTMKSLGLGKRSLEYVVQEEAQSLVKMFMDTKGKPTNPCFALTLAVSNVVCAVVFGKRFSTDDKTFHELLEAMESIFKYAGSIHNNIYDFLPRLMCHLPGPHRKVMASRDFVWSFIKREISKHRDMGIPEEPQDFIHFYLAQLQKCKDDPNPVYDESNMIQCIFDLFLGGTETTSTTLYWVILYMVLYPDIQANVQKEIDAVVAPGEMICYADRKNLPYTNAVTHEAQRFSNIVVTGMPRMCMKDTVVCQFPVKRGTVLLPNMASALYDPNEWETPRQFNPGHFLDKDGNFFCRDAFIPFSTGQRICLGENLAKTELFIFVSNILRAFTLRLAEGSKDVTPEPVSGGTLQPQYFEICAVPR